MEVLSQWFSVHSYSGHVLQPVIGTAVGDENVLALIGIDGQQISVIEIQPGIAELLGILQFINLVGHQIIHSQQDAGSNVSISARQRRIGNCDRWRAGIATTRTHDCYSPFP